MSDSVRPHRWQPTRLPRPWDSPGKSTGVGCHFLLQYMKVKVKVNSLSRVRFLATSWTAAHQAPLSMGFARQEYWSGVPSPSLCQSLRAANYIQWGIPTASVLCFKCVHLIHSSCNRRRRRWHPTPELLPGKSHGWRSLVGCSPWGR